MDNQTIAHRFFYSEDRYFAPAGYNMWYDGDCFYSFSTIVGMKVDGLDGCRYLLISDDNMTPTTGRHISYLRSACPHGRILRVPMEYGDSYFEVGYIVPRLVERLKSLKELSMTRKENRQQFIDAYNALLSAAAVVKYKKSVLTPFKKLYDALTDPEKVAAIKAKAAEKAALSRKKLKAELDALLTAHTVEELAQLAYSLNSKLDTTLKSKLKKYLNPGNNLSFAWRTAFGFSTSQGVNVSKAEADRIIALYKAGKLHHGETLARYVVLSVTDAAVKIGCHLIPMSNIKCFL